MPIISAVLFGSFISWVSYAALTKVLRFIRAGGSTIQKGCGSIYVAHNLDARLSLRELLKPIEQLGYLITSTWIYDDSHVESKNRTESADDDVTDIERADIFLLFVDQFGDRPGRGKWFEWGYAAASGKTIILVGEDTACVFYWMTSENTYKCRTLEEAIKLLEEGICE